MHDLPILAFDCAAIGASIALSVRGATHHVGIPQGRQSAELVAAIDGLMRAHGVAYAELSAIVTTVGPGSFTGLRVGLAALHGLVLAHPVPVKTTSTLAAMAWEVTRQSAPPARFFISLRAGKGEMYVQEFSVLDAAPVAISEITLAPEGLDDWSAPCYGNMPNAANFIAGAHAETLCAIAPFLAETPIAEALPLYIRPPDAKIPAAEAWLV